MHRAHALAALNGKILAAYSNRTIAALRSTLAMRVALPHLEPVLAMNVHKEIRKDSLVIRHAGRAVAAGSHAGPADVQALYQETLAIDAAFLQSLESFPVRLVIPYAEIEPVRVRRIRHVIRAADAILSAWPQHRGLKATLHAVYERTDFELLISIILDLYAQETRVLSRSVRLPSALAPLQDRLARHVGSVMSDAGMHLAKDLARGIYRT
jgi:hypothetical protein